MRLLVKIHLPYSLILIFTLTMRFFPLLLQDLSVIGDVQQTRGYELHKGNLWTRLRQRMGLILPLLSNSLERSIQASEALEARGFSTSHTRTHYRMLAVSTEDSILVLIWLSAVVCLIYLRTLGFGLYVIYPLVLLIPPTLWDGVICLGWLTIVFGFCEDAISPRLDGKTPVS